MFRSAVYSSFSMAAAAEKVSGEKLQVCACVSFPDLKVSPVKETNQFCTTCNASQKSLGRCVSVVQNITAFFIAWVNLVLIGVKNTPLLQKSVTPHPSLSHIFNLNFLPKVYVTKSKMLVSLVAWLLSGGSGCVTHGFLSFSFGFSVFLKSNIVENR